MNKKYVLCKNKFMQYICQRNVYKMSEKIFVTKSFKVLFYRRVSLPCSILYNYMLNAPQEGNN